MEIKAPVIREFKWLFRKITLLMVVYHTWGSCGLSKVCANGKQKSLVVSSILIAHFTIYSPTPNLLREPRIINSKMAAGAGEKLEMVTTFSIRKFRLKIVDYRTTVQDHPFLSVEPKLLSHHLPKFPEFLGKCSI